MIRAVILVESGFQDEEFVYPYYRMLEEIWKVDVASPDGDERRGKYGIPAKVNKIIGKLLAIDYDAVIIPGGYESPDRLRTHVQTLDFIRNMDFDGKLIGAICHGPWVLIDAGIVKGRSVTAYGAVKTDLKNAGAEVVPSNAVVVDGNLITAQHYRDNGYFMNAVVQWMAYKHAVAHV